MRNQCDGCQAGVPTEMRGSGLKIHRSQDDDWWTVMACTAQRYEDGWWERKKAEIKQIYEPIQRAKALSKDSPERD